MNDIKLVPDIFAQQHLQPIEWKFSREDAAQLAFTQAVDAINRVYHIPGNAAVPGGDSPR